MNRLAQDITGIRTAVTMKRELDAHRERERSISVSGKPEEDDNAHEIMDSFQEHVGPSLNALAVSTPYRSIISNISRQSSTECGAPQPSNPTDFLST